MQQGEVEMSADQRLAWNRRDFLRTLSIASAVAATGIRPAPAFAEPPPEVTSLRIIYDPEFPILCYGPQFIARKLLELEGFTDVSYVPYDPSYSDAKLIAQGEADITAAWAGDLLSWADQHGSVVALSGMHRGCTEIFASDRVRSFRDLKGKKVGLYAFDSIEHLWFASMFAYIGLDPERDIEWVIHPYEEWGPRLSEGDVDAIMLWPPDAQIFREQGIGHVVFNTTTDRPWKTYFCCMVAGNGEFVANYPVATKRALRAMLKATDMCALEPEQAADAVMEDGFPTDFERAVQVFKEVPYDEWRDYDPVDTLRFYAVRLHELGFIQQTPDALLASSTDWRFLNELKRELKA